MSKRNLTDDQLRAVVEDFILDGVDSDCLYEMDGLEAESDLDRAYELFDEAVVTVTWGGND